MVVSEWVGRGNTPVRKRRKKQRKLGMLRDTLRVSTLVTRLSTGGRQWLLQTGSAGLAKLLLDRWVAQATANSSFTQLLLLNTS